MSPIKKPFKKPKGKDYQIVLDFAKDPKNFKTISQSESRKLSSKSIPSEIRFLEKMGDPKRREAFKKKRLEIQSKIKARNEVIDEFKDFVSHFKDKHKIDLVKETSKNAVFFLFVNFRKYKKASNINSLKVAKEILKITKSSSFLNYLKLQKETLLEYRKSSSKFGKDIELNNCVLFLNNLLNEMTSKFVDSSKDKNSQIKSIKQEIIDLEKDVGYFNKKISYSSEESQEFRDAIDEKKTEIENLNKNLNKFKSNSNKIETQISLDKYFSEKLLLYFSINGFTKSLIEHIKK